MAANFAGMSLTKDEQVFLGHLGDLARSGKLRFTKFLSEREQALARLAVGREAGAVFFGGYENAERVILGMFPESVPKDLSAFPIFPVTLVGRKGITLDHRSVLGSLMGQHLTRESVGDILISGHIAYVFLLEVAGQVVLRDLDKIGREGITCKAGLGEGPLPERQFDIRETTVSSMRLDGLVAALTNSSRTAAASLIASGLVSLDGLPITEGARTVRSGHKLSIRGYGKAAIVEKGPTKKGRLRIEIRKYQ